MGGQAGLAVEAGPVGVAWDLGCFAGLPLGLGIVSGVGMWLLSEIDDCVGVRSG